MKKIVVDMQNFLFADSIATAFKNSDYDIAVVRAESPRDTIELCRVFKPFVLLMEVTAYSTAQTGTLKSIPKTPNAPPPIVTAISTSSPGRPTDFPTTFG